MKGTRYTELLTLIFAALVFFFISFPLDRFSGTIPGHLLGIAGTFLITATLAFPFRKRIRGLKGKSNPLHPHVYFGLIGAILVTMHAGGRSSTIGLLVYLSLFIVVISGVVGRILLSRVNRSVKDQKNDVEVLREAFHTLKNEIDPKLCFRALLVQSKLEDQLSEETESADLQLNPEINTRCMEFRRLAESIAAKEEVIEVYARTKTLFRFWNGVHVMCSFALFAMIIVHVFTTAYYGLRWLP